MSKDFIGEILEQQSREATQNLEEMIFDGVLKKWMLLFMYQSLMQSAGNDINKAIDKALALVASVEDDVTKEMSKAPADELAQAMAEMIGPAEQEMIRRASTSVGKQIEQMFRTMHSKLGK